LLNIVVEAASYIRKIRLDLNRDLTEAKSRIKEGAINLFIAHLHTLIDAEKDASEGFKNSFNGKEREIALDTIKGKSKNFKKLMNEKLKEIKYDLARNGKQNKELIPAFSIRMSLASSKVSWSVFNSLIFLDTSAISSSSAIVSPLNLSAPALDTIKGKSKNFKKLMNEKLQEIKYDLARNGKQTKEQKLVISYLATFFAFSIVPSKSTIKPSISSTSVSIGFSLTTGSTCFCVKQ
jgi:flagellar biosynthesis chaperone FliJ